IRLFEGDNPDPSIVRYKDTYYMVHSSFIYTPGLVVYKSANLIDWTPCSVALPEYAGDIWAPDICVHNDRFYIYFPTRDERGKTNMVTWTDDPEGEWSKPVNLNVGGIDPEHVAGPDGERYLLLSAGDLHPLSADGCSITGKPEIIYKGWEIPEEWDIESFSLEGLNIKKIGDYYYLLAAEGGTAGPPTGHMVVQARAKSIHGPWENAPQNPLLRTESPQEKWWSQGHGSIVDTPDGKLYLLFHAYEKGYLTLGRQTLMREVEMGDDGWLHLKEGNISLPQPAIVNERGIKDYIWQPTQERLADRFTITDDAITIKGKGKGPQEGSPLLLRAGDHSYEIEACIELNNEKASAGLVVYYDKNMHFGLGFKPDQLLRYRRGGVSRQMPKCDIAMKDGACKLWVKLRYTEHIVNGWYSTDGQTWHKYPWGFDMQGYHHNTLGGFLSVRPGIYAGGDGEAKITHFVYRKL
ncbi:MAG: family 43 glycosylhydrolase, partial [Bacteroides sp.]|nr:family 43 glycosylhydrolase [Bacteroides sp.]